MHKTCHSHLQAVAPICRRPPLKIHVVPSQQPVCLPAAGDPTRAASSACARSMPQSSPPRPCRHKDTQDTHTHPIIDKECVQQHTNRLNEAL